MNCFDTKKFSMRREILKRFLETDPSKETMRVEETNFYDVFTEKVTKEHLEFVSENNWN